MMMLARAAFPLPSASIPRDVAVLRAVRAVGDGDAGIRGVVPRIVGDSGRRSRDQQNRA
jgi:hypothetical protein